MSTSNYIAPPTGVNVVPGLGTSLQIGSAPVSPVYSTIAHRVSIDGPDTKVGTAEQTHLDSVAKEFRPTLPEGGDVSMTIWYDPNSSGHETLTGLVTTPAVLPFRLVFADGKTVANAMITFSAMLTNFKVHGMDEEGNLSADVTFKITGLPVYTAGS
jgi:hypothetical protein